MGSHTAPVSVEYPAGVIAGLDPDGRYALLVASCATGRVVGGRSSSRHQPRALLWREPRCLDRRDAVVS